MATIKQIETAIANADRAGDKNAVVRLTTILEKAKGTLMPGGEMSFMEAAGRGLSNIPTSAGKYVDDLTTAVTDPLGTLQAIGDLGAGALREGARAVLPTPVFSALDSLGSQEGANRASDTATAVGRMYADRYGSWDGFKRAIAEDPVGVAADLSAPLTGATGVAAKMPGMTGRVARAANVVARNLDPVSAVGNTLASGGRAISALGGYASGVGDAPLAEAFTARRTGGVPEKRFLDNMRNPNTRLADVVDEAKANLDQFEATGGSAYRQGIKSTKDSLARVNYVPIIQSVYDGMRTLMTKSGRFYGGPQAKAAVQRIITTLQDYASDPRLQRPEALDALKQELANMQITPGPGVSGDALQANRVVTRVIDEIRKELTRIVPEYGQTMSEYADMKGMVNEIERALSVHDKASTDTTLRKLQSTMRNNVQTNYGARNQLMDVVDPERTIRAALAGQSLNTWAPRGIARAGGAAAIPAAIAYMTSNPGMVAATALSAPIAMPRVVGEVAGLLGAGARKMDQAKTAAPKRLRNTVSSATGRNGRFVTQEIGGIANEAEAMLEDAQGNVYDRKGRLIRRGQQ